VCVCVCVCVWVCVCDDFDSESALGLNPEVVTLNSGTLYILRNFLTSIRYVTCIKIIWASLIKAVRILLNG
jgi:hypothetical protein